MHLVDPNADYPHTNGRKQGEGGQTLCSDNHQGVVVFGPGGRNWAPEPGPDLTFFRDIMTEIKTQKRTLTEKAKKRNERATDGAKKMLVM